MQGNKERLSTTLEEICGLEVGQWNDGVAFTLAVLCLTQTTLLGFDSKEALLAWEARLRYSLGEGEQNLAFRHFQLMLWSHVKNAKSDLAVMSEQVPAAKWKDPSCCVVQERFLVKNCSTEKMALWVLIILFWLECGPLEVGSSLMKTCQRMRRIYDVLQVKWSLLLRLQHSFIQAGW